MQTTIDQPNLQERTLRFYGELLCSQSEWGGQLVLSAFAGAASTGFATAASLAGAASLTVDSDAAAMKTHFRDGAFDFVVNTLDEALRALKNEIRQKRAIALGLIGDPALLCAEAIERGLAAAVVLAAHEQSTQTEKALVTDRGLILRNAGDSFPSPDLSRWLKKRDWVPELSDDSALHQDAIRQRWHRGLTAHQRSVSKGARWHWVSCDEQGLTDEV